MSRTPKVFLVNPAWRTTGTAFVMPAAQVTLAGAIPGTWDIEIVIIDEAVKRFDPRQVKQGDIVCVSALTNSCRPAYRVVLEAKGRGATVIMGGPHPTLLPDEALRHGADAVVRGEGDVVFKQVLEDALMNRIPTGGIYQDPSGNPFRVAGYQMAYPRLDLVDMARYMTASLRSTAGCREHCTFCTVPTIGGSVPRDRPAEQVAREIRELHARGIRFVTWGADNLVQVPLSLIREHRGNPAERKTLEAAREQSLKFFREVGKLTDNERVWGFAQLTMRLYDDEEMLSVLRNEGAICAALFGIESVNAEALHRMAKGWNGTRNEMIAKVQQIQRAGIHVLGSMIVGLPTDTLETIAEMRKFADASGMSAAQFTAFELLPGSPDYHKAQRDLLSGRSASQLPIAPSSGGGPRVKLLRDNYWLEPPGLPPHLDHPCLSPAQWRAEISKSWQHFYRLSHLLRNTKGRNWPLSRIMCYIVACKAFAGFYGGGSVGISTDSVQTNEASFLQKKKMAAGAWLMHQLPPPPAVHK